MYCCNNRLFFALFSQDFHFRFQVSPSIHPVASSRAAGFRFSLSGASVAPGRSSSLAGGRSQNRQVPPRALPSDALLRAVGQALGARWRTEGIPGGEQRETETAGEARHQAFGAARLVSRRKRGFASLTGSPISAAACAAASGRAWRHGRQMTPPPLPPASRRSPGCGRRRPCWCDASGCRIQWGLG